MDFCFSILLMVILFKDIVMENLCFTLEVDSYICAISFFIEDNSAAILFRDIGRMNTSASTLLRKK